ncbi:MAG TPA: NAD-binding protein [Vulgatibacter sp.]|nr:NAD-binding protein [Vulgatibacter sp.]
MKIVIAGGGHVGGALAARLAADRNAVTVIDRDREVCDRLFEELGVVTVAGDAHDLDVLERAGIRSADVAAGLLPRDADNLAFAVLARSVSSARLLARMSDASCRDAYRLAGVQEVISEADLLVSEITKAIDFPELGGSLSLASGEVVLFELPISLHARIAGRAIAQVRADPDYPGDCVIAGVVGPGGRFELPADGSILRAGHTLVAACRRDRLGEALAFLGAEPVDEDAIAQRPVREALRKVDFLAPLSDAELGDLAREMTFVRKGAGEELFREGDPGEEFFVVLSGEIALVGREGATVQAVGPGGFFGEIALLTGDARSTGARAARDSELLSIGREAFSRVMMSNPTIALEMSRILGQRLARATQSLQEARPPRRLFGR